LNKNVTCKIITCKSINKQNQLKHRKMKRNKIIFYVVTGLFSLLMAGGAMPYFFMHDFAVEMFESLGYPPYLIYLMGVAKILGLVAIWFIKSPTLKEWAYAGFTFNLLLAISAHVNVGDGKAIGAIVPLTLMATSYYFYRKIKATA
jgi:hypothetical protein